MAWTSGGHYPGDPKDVLSTKYSHYASAASSSLLPPLCGPGHPVQGAASVVRHTLSPLEVVQDAVLILFLFLFSLFLSLFLFSFFPFPPLLFSTGSIDTVCGEQVVTMDKLG